MPTTYSTTPLTGDQQSFLKERMTLLVERNPSWGISATDFEQIWYYFSAQKITYLYDQELYESMVFTDFKKTGKAEELLDAYMLLEEDDELQLKLFQFKFSEKWSGGISTKELYAFVDRMNRVFLKTDLQDEETLQAYKEVQAAIDAARSGRRRGKKRLRVQCYYVTNGQSLSPSDAPKVEQLRSTFANDRQSFGFTFETYSANDLYNLCAFGRIPIQREILEMSNTMGERSFLHHNIGQNPNGMPIQVLVGFVNVHQFIRLVDKYSNNELFEKNVRFFLGTAKDVNRRIIQTVTSHQSSWFGFMNNGVSVVADNLEVLPPPSGNKMSVRLDNMQIINGCQTVNALYHAKYDPELRDHFQGNSEVLVRIYQVDPANSPFLDALIVATNSQNAIRPEDLLSNDPRQVNAQTILNQYGIHYQRKEGEAQPSGSRAYSFSKEQAALSWLSVFKGYTSKLRNSASKREIFHEGEGSEYDDAFAAFSEPIPDTTSARKRALEFAFACILHQLCSSKIDTLGSNRRERGPLRKAVYYLISGIKLLADRQVDELLSQACAREPDPSEIRALSAFSQNLLQEHFNKVVTKYQACLHEYIQSEGGTEDAALKNSAFAEKFQKLIDLETD